MFLFVYQNEQFHRGVFVTSSWFRVGASMRWSLHDCRWTLPFSDVVVSAFSGICTPCFKDSLDDTWSESLSQSQCRKLQRSIGKFHNADTNERLTMLMAAEDKLQELLHSSDADGDAISRLAVSCVGWLRARRCFTGRRVLRKWRKGSKIAPKLPTCNGVWGGCWFDAYSHWTWRIQTHPRLWLQRCILSGNCCRRPPRIMLWQPSKAARQWRELQALVASAQDASPLARRSNGGAIESQNQLEGRAHSAGGIYRPSQKVLALSKGFLPATSPLLVRCGQCTEYAFRSSWYWRHPGSGKIHVLVPHWGHRACSVRLGKKCPWLIEGGTPQKNDRIQDLEMCSHNRTKKFCKDCNTGQVCVHSRLRYSCRFCKDVEGTKTCTLKEKLLPGGDCCEALSVPSPQKKKRTLLNQ